MGILDFIKNRQGQKQPNTDQSQPETAKQMYTREAGQPSPKLQDVMSSDQLAKASQVERAGITGGQDMTGSNAAPSQAPSGGATSPQPMRQMSMQQDNPAPALSPTSAQRGSPASGKEPSAPTPPSTPKPTLPRTTPSWER